MSLKNLHTAIDQLDKNRVQELLLECADVNYVYSQETALTKAIRLKADDIVKVILEYHDCNVNARNQFDRTPLYYAALDGNVDLAKFLLERGSNVDQADIGGVTPLAATAWYDHWEIAELLIGWGASLNYANKKGETPLFRACSTLSLNIVRILIDHGSDVNMKTSQCRTPLMATVLAYDNDNAKNKTKRVKIMKLLLENGAFIDMQDHKSFSALHFAVEGNDIYGACLLMEYGCNLYLTNNENLSPFDMAISQGKQHFQLAVLFFLYGFHLPAFDGKVIQTLLFKNKYLQTNESSRKMLLSIILEEIRDSFENRAVLAEIKDRNSDINEFDSTCFQLVQQHSRTMISPSTLQHKCRKTIRKHLQKHFLHNLKQLNIPRDLKVILSYGIDIRFNSLEVCRFFLAIEDGSFSDVKQSLETEIDKNTIYDGKTPMMTAALSNNTDVVRYLLSIQANCDYQNENGDTAIHLAARQGHTEILRLFLNCNLCSIQKNIKGNTAFHEALAHGNIDCALLLANYCSEIDINNPDSRGIPPLHYAVGNGSSELTSCLLKKGVCVNKQDMNGNTGLHVAATQGAVYIRENIELPALFDSKVSSVLATTSLMMCDIGEIGHKYIRFHNSNSHTEILNLLLEAGCDFNILNNDRKKTADLRKEYGFQDIVSSFMQFH